MLTRTSPRNQERLWRELGGRQERPAPAPPADVVADLQAKLGGFIGSRRYRRELERELEREQLRAKVCAALANT